MDEYSSTPAIAFIRKFGLVSLLGILGIGSLVYGLIQYLPQDRNPEVSFDEPQLRVTPVIAPRIMVDVSGAVLKPGVYSFEAESRIVDAIQKAGGLSKTADQNYIAKMINEAMKLTDGMKIYIPKNGENVTAPAVAKTSTSTDNAVLGIQTGGISINSATESELDSLPGVGPVTAGKIISGRPYVSVEELLSKKVVSSSVYGKIKDKVSL